MPTPGNTPDKITYFAETDYRSKRIKFGIRDDDRTRHMYVIGKTGMGKSTLLENLAIQDIQNGEGVCFIDPHGGSAETMLSYVPEHRVKDVIYFAPFDQEYPVALNVLEDIGKDKRQLVASGLMGAFKKVWVDAWSARMEYILGNELLALLEYPGSTLLGVNRMLADKNYRNMIVAKVTDPSVKAFWTDEFAKYSDKFATEASAAIQNKVGQFSANPLIRNMIGQQKSTFDIRQVMDERKILIVNLSKGRMGEGNASLVGSMLTTKIYLAAMSRADVGPEEVKDLPPFYLYVDEFQSFANESFVDILSEARKYKLSLTIAHQYIEQASEEVRAAVFGNVGTMISFRVGAYDAEVLEKEFAPAFTAEDMVNLGFAQIYLKLLIKGVGSPPFSATTLPQPKRPPRTFVEEVIQSSREQFGRPRAEVEEEIRKWHEPVPEQPRDPNAPPETRKYPPGMRPARPPAVTARAGAEYAGGPQRSPSPYGAAQPQYGAARQQQYAPQYPPPGQFFPPQQGQFVQYPQGGMPYPQPPLVPYPGVPSYQQSAPPVSRGDALRSPARNEATPPRATAHSGEAAPPPSHQPFRSELAKLVDQGRESDTASFGGRRPEEDRGRQKVTSPVSLSALKSQPKRDKGPSETNLSSLKAVLGTAFVAPRGEREREPAQKKIPIAPPPSAPAPEKKPQLLDERDAKSSPPKEVPEDVLKGLLED